MTFPEPRAERPFPPSLEPRKLTDYDEEYFLGQVGGLVAQSGDAAKPATDQRKIDLLQAPPVRCTRPGHLQAVEQAEGSRVHGLRPDGFFGVGFGQLVYNVAIGNASSRAKLTGIYPTTADS